MTQTEIRVKPFSLSEPEFNQVVEIAGENFSGMRDKINAGIWIRLKYIVHPISQYYLALSQNKVSGYVLWTQHGGFREEVFVELEQIAVKKSIQGQGIGLQLILQSFSILEKQFKESNSFVKTVLVTTNTANEAQRLYLKAFKELDFVLSDSLVVHNLFKGDELYMFFKRLA